MVQESQRQIIDERQFAALLSGRATELLAFLNLLLGLEEARWKKRHYNQLGSLCHDLETFLDDYDSRNNRSFSYPTELVASLRGFAKIGVSLTHLMGRLSRYDVQLTKEQTTSFLAETERTFQFLTTSMRVMMRDLIRAAGDLGVTVSARAAADESLPEERVRLSLPDNIDDEDLLDEERKIAEVASRYMRGLERVGRLAATTLRRADDLRDFVLKQVDEERSREFEAMVHSLQSKYDTYIRNTVLEARTPSLPRLRGHISLALHLLEVCTELVHFYVRHENDIRYEAAKAGIAGLVNKTEVLDRAINYAFHFAADVLRAGEPLAQEALATFVQVQELTVELPEGATLHARPISLIVKIVHHHGTHVVMDLGGESCDAASIMEIIMIAGNVPDARRVLFRGDARTLRDLRLLFESGMGERGMDVLPPELHYLR